MIEACEQLPVELDIVEGVPHDEARERYARADIVVDQLNAGWHGVFALESMALGKPVVTHLKPDVVERSAAGLRRPPPDRACDRRHARRRAAAAGRAACAPPGDRRAEPRVRRAGARHRPGRRPPDRPLPFASSVSLAFQIRRLARHSAIYGLGGILSRLLAVFLLPLYTSYLGTKGFGKIEIVTALSTVLVIVLSARHLERVLPLLLRLEGPGAAHADRAHVVLVHDGDGDRRARARLSRSPRRSRICSSSATTRGSSAPARSGSGRR